jgi:holo-[acyl-carrier protein] synthase
MLREGLDRHSVAIGVDVVDVERIRRAHLSNGELFLRKVFHSDEIDYCLGRRFPHQSLAARFAAKEAVAKALGTGMGSGVTFRSIAVIGDANGRPSVRLSGMVEKLFRRLGWKQIDLSMSHTSTVAIAHVIFSR